MSNPQIINRDLVIPEGMKGKELKSFLRENKLHPLRRKIHRRKNDVRKHTFDALRQAKADQYYNQTKKENEIGFKIVN